jgi:hypothetical protein
MSNLVKDQVQGSRIAVLCVLHQETINGRHARDETHPELAEDPANDHEQRDGGKRSEEHRGPHVRVDAIWQPIDPSEHRLLGLGDAIEPSQDEHGDGYDHQRSCQDDDVSPSTPHDVGRDRPPRCVRRHVLRCRD